MNIRNIAIIAHVDHGKTTLVDKLIRTATNQTKSMDSNAIEQERGITILSKNTTIHYKDYLINILDTPGHADFSGEVERIMSMVDGVLLLVDAFEGTMPQTRFVLKQALDTNKQVIVVINKIDRPNIDLKRTINSIYDLFIELGADENQLEFPILYTSALKGTSSDNPDISTQKPSLDLVLDTVIKYIKAPDEPKSDELQMQISLLDYNDYVGRIGIGLIKSGTIKVNEMVSIFKNDQQIDFRVQKIMGYNGLEKIELQEASAGMIVSISGLPTISVGDTINTLGIKDPLPPIHIAEPTLKMTFMVNDSPFAGQDGKVLTSRKIEERLFKETEKDVSLKVEKVSNDSFIVSGRGELHLSILIENLRRENFELQVQKPEVILKEENGKIYEPYEDLYIDLPEEYVGNIIDFVGRRGGVLINMKQESQTKLHFEIPSRGLIGFNTEFMSQTKGYGIANHIYKDYRKLENGISNERVNGVLVSMGPGKVTAYRLGYLEDRGIMFVSPGDPVYEGMIIGENNKDNDLVVNVTEGKAQTNMRQATKDNTVILKKPRKLTLEYCLDYINHDELIEVTPHNLRLRKKILNSQLRKKENIKENIKKSE